MVGVLVPLAALLALLGWAMARSGGQPGGFAVNSVFGEAALSGDTARDFTLPLFGGGELRLSDLRGKVVMVDFWSSWCPPCREEAPVLAATYRRYREQGVEFIGVAIWDTEEEATKFIRREGLDYPSGLDDDGSITIDYGVTGIPEKYFIDREGRLVRKFIGPVSAWDLERVLTGLLAQ
jgi:cytochrome c biogenesis protein CcmG/thiol:disulfide interchange protein DsbE